MYGYGGSKITRIKNMCVEIKISILECGSKFHPNVIKLISFISRIQIIINIVR